MGISHLSYIASARYETRLLSGYYIIGFTKLYTRTRTLYNALLCIISNGTVLSAQSIKLTYKMDLYSMRCIQYRLLAYIYESLRITLVLFLQVL